MLRHVACGLVALAFSSLTAKAADTYNKAGVMDIRLLNV